MYNTFLSSKSGRFQPERTENSTKIQRLFGKQPRNAYMDLFVAQSHNKYGGRLGTSRNRRWDSKKVPTIQEPIDYTQRSLKFRNQAFRTNKMGKSFSSSKTKPKFKNLKKKKLIKNEFSASVLPLKDLKNSITELVDKSHTVNEMIEKEKIKIFEERKIQEKKEEEERHKRVQSMPEKAFKWVPQPADSDSRQKKGLIMMTNPKINQKNIPKILLKNERLKSPEQNFRVLFERKQSLRLNSQRQPLQQTQKIDKEEEGTYRSFIKKFAPGVFKPPDILKINGKMFRNKSVTLKNFKRRTGSLCGFKVHSYKVEE